jgi:hypothetical protein
MALFCHSGVVEAEGTLGMELMLEVNPLMCQVRSYHQNGILETTTAETALKL